MVGLWRGGPPDQYIQGSWPDGFRYPEVGTIETASKSVEIGTDDTAQAVDVAIHHTVTETTSTSVCYDTERCHHNGDHEYDDATSDRHYVQDDENFNFAPEDDQRYDAGHVDDNGIEEHDDDSYQDHVPEDHANAYQHDY